MMNDTSLQYARKLTRARAAGFGVGDFGFNLFFTGLSLFLLKYYTDILEIDPVTAGFIFMISVLWDAITDPLMGWLSSRTRSRWGTYRGYILFGTPIMAISYVMMFAAPLIFPAAIVISSAVAHIIFRTAYTIVSIPYSTLMAAMTHDSRERGLMAGFRMFFALSGGLFTAFLTLQLAQAFGGENLKLGFVKTAIVFAVIATMLLWITFASSYELSQPNTSKTRPSTRDSLRFVVRNKAFWLLFCGVFCAAFGNSIASKTLLYYIEYYMGQPEAISGVLAAGLLAMALSIPLWAIVSRFVSKRNVWLLGAALTVSSQCALLYLGTQQVQTLVSFHVMGSIGYGAIAITFWSMLPDTVEYGQWRSGIRDEGILFGLNQLALKAAAGFGVGLLGILLARIGYVANIEQTVETQQGLKLLTFGAQIIGMGLSAVVIFFYPIDHKMHAWLRAEIEASPKEN